ncbi:MAG: endonuclease/exonuclease/phosphatase family protein, partial [Alistipes sp.]|nr:endonuclease/exonuclease/phosphatase family protein [Alistipes sp.]
GAKRKIKEVGPEDMYNPFIDMLRAGHGTLAYQDAWNLFDNIVISENLATGSTGELKIQKAEGSKFYGNIFRKPYMVQREGQYKGYPLRTFVGTNFQGGYSDHFPVYIYIAK